MKKRLISVVAMLAMLVALLSVSAFAADTDVAQIGETTYATLDEAVTAAADGDTITVLADCETAGLNLSKDLTIKGAENVNPTITFNTYGMALWANVDLVFEDCTVKMNNITSTPYTGEWNWMAICASSGVSLTLNNVDMSIVCTESNTAHCIYFCSNNKLNLNDSNLLIQGYQQDALEWDGGDGGYNVNIINSTYTSESNRSGFTGTFYATIDNSDVNVLNSSGNGSNGTYYTIKNNSNVVFNNNGSWGISAWRIDMTNNSTLTACDNNYSGVWTRVLNVDSTCTLDVERNGAKSTGYTTNAGIFFQGNGSYTSTIEAGAKVTIKDNAGCGIYTKQSVCNLTINTDAVITNNGTGAVDANGHGAEYGGGVYNVGTLVLCDDVIIYNNHADVAGDDIYSNGAKSITFGDVNSNATWVLDDCEHVIDGWYEDGYETVDDSTQRWSANCEDEGYTYTELRESGTFSATALAYKAAHGVGAKVTEPGLNKTIVLEDGTEVDADDVAAGDTVDYKLLSTIPSTLSDYITYAYGEDNTAVGTVNDGSVYTLTFHDVLDSTLTCNDDLKVYIGSDELSSNYYTVTKSTDDGCTFEVSMDLLALYTADIINEADFGKTSITVTYSATLSEDATAGAYYNTAWVGYPEDESEKDKVEVDTYKLSVFKYDQEDNSGLAGAEFTVYSDEDCTDVIATLTSGEDGYATLDGLDAGTYYLKETAAPEGYVKADTVLTVTIPDDVTEYVASVSFANAPIPSTGGAGTTMYTVVGICIILAAGLALVVTRKTRKEE